PGENGLTVFVYDRKLRPIMRQTPEERNAGQWEVTYYDDLDRVVATSLFTSAQNRTYWQDQVDNYSGTAYPTSDIRFFLLTEAGEGQQPTDNAVPGNTMMSYNWYDDYAGTDPNSTLYNDATTTLQFTETQNIAG